MKGIRSAGGLCPSGPWRQSLVYTKVLTTRTQSINVNQMLQTMASMQQMPMNVVLG